MTAALSFSEGGLAVKTERAGQELIATFTGVAELPAVTALSGLLTSLHAQATAEHITSVTADLRALEFMNSACFKNFVTWIVRIQEAPEDRRYKVRIRSNAEVLWQRRSLHALKNLGAGLIEVES